MPDYELLFPSKYLRAADLRGKDVALTIARVAVNEPVVEKGGAEKKKPALYFTETAAAAQRNGEEEKRLILKRSCGNIIAKHHGKDYDAWPGKRIVLYSSPEFHFGKPMDVVRVRDVAAPAPQPQPQPAATEPAK